MKVNGNWSRASSATEYVGASASFAPLQELLSISDPARHPKRISNFRAGNFLFRGRGKEQPGPQSINDIGRSIRAGGGFVVSNLIIRRLVVWLSRGSLGKDSSMGLQ